MPQLYSFCSSSPSQYISSPRRNPSLEKAHSNRYFTKFICSFVDLLVHLNMDIASHFSRGGTIGVGYLGVVFTSV